MISTRLDLIGVLVLDFGNLVLLISLLVPGFGSIEAIFRFVDQGIDRFLAFTFVIFNCSPTEIPHSD